MVLVMASKSTPEEAFSKLKAELEAARPLIVTAQILDALDTDFENPKIVSERLGHASVVLTLDTYSHILPSMQRSAADKLESTMFGNG